MNKLDNLLNWYSTMTCQSVSDCHLFYEADAHFKDPFNDVHGIDLIEKIFLHMFETTNNPRFLILETIEQDQQAFVTWLFKFSLKGKDYTIQGGSHLKFGEQGLVTEHRDYWDAAEELLQHLPIIGKPIQWLRRQFEVK
ncbi:nuclear transport factor 2 family protein [Aquirhabdus parva]|uniref:Nuclear transport factor 2 family protein n=1 Tax=Aquirhabdus parva TaxID=2283318 RepID=A0A345P4V4_9GAMM|nr:nuclear transport factor 2 family protein [Aquirhabdus parva]AXI02313.1 nuclear transport factor 2 family protein [Aquirhabdus parva]